MLLIMILLSLIALGVILSLFERKKKVSLINKHVVVTGGSSGIGKELAKLAIRRGANVTIVARNVERLDEAYNDLKKVLIFDDQVITRISADVSNYDDIKLKLIEAEELVGPIFMLANCAGFAMCRNLEDYLLEDIKKMIDVNYLGTLYPIKILLPKFKERRKGIIILTASQVALMGMFGYSVYSSCKFALRGLAESLNMEIKQYNISITLALPPDTDTPGYAEENKTKPLETKLISKAGGLCKPKDVATNILEDALSGKFFSTIGFESFMLTTLCAGMSPLNTLREVFSQFFLLGPLRAIGLIYLSSFDNTIKQCHSMKARKNDN